jgi:hypothetical protein
MSEARALQLAVDATWNQTRQQRQRVQQLTLTHISSRICPLPNTKTACYVSGMKTDIEKTTPHWRVRLLALLLLECIEDEYANDTPTRSSDEVDSRT